MTRYRYQSDLIPPAPFVLVTLQNPLTGVSREDLPAQLDTAADRTLIPDELAHALALPRSGTIPIGGVGGTISAVALHYAEITLPESNPLRLEVVVCAGEPWVLLGRYVLNAVRMMLDGPQLALEIG